MRFERTLVYTLPMMRGQDVVAVQRRLTAVGVPNVVVDGLYGPGAQRGVVSFQRSTGITVDGKVGPVT
jgi:peptidoglycan hydrolase-like protein with peptidoglycan-binding domain